MASAEKLLQEAQFAFANISFGESRDNKRNAARARMLSRKIIRQFPGSTEAAEAHAVLRRLGDEAYVSNLSARHVHQSQADHHRREKPQRQSHPRKTRRETTITTMEEVVELEWGAVFRWLTSRPLSILVVITFTALILVSTFGPLLLLPAIVLVAFTGPFRKLLNLEQGEVLDNLIKRVNAFVSTQR